MREIRAGFWGGGVDVSSESAGVSFTDGYLVIEGLKYGDTVYIRPQAAAEVTDERYYVRGVRRSGRDNSEAEAPTFRVASDRDYVMAYGIRGNMAAYTVHLSLIHICVMPGSGGSASCAFFSCQSGGPAGGVGMAGDIQRQKHGQ